MMMATHRDPVCGMDIEEQDAAGTSQLDGQKYYFCNTACKKQFDANPRRYAAKPTADQTKR